MNTLENISIARIGYQVETPDGMATVTAGTLNQLLDHLSIFDEGLKIRAGQVEKLESIIGVLLNFRIEGGHLVADFEPLEASESGQALLTADPDKLELRLDGDFFPKDGEIKVARIRCGLVTPESIPDPAQVKADKEQFLQAFRAAGQSIAAKLSAKFRADNARREKRHASELAARRREREELALEVAEAEEVNARREEAERKRQQMLEHYRNLCASTR